MEVVRGAGESGRSRRLEVVIAYRMGQPAADKRRRSDEAHGGIPMGTYEIRCSILMVTPYAMVRRALRGRRRRW